MIGLDRVAGCFTEEAVQSSGSQTVDTESR
jgi:hypothetical protein